MRRPVALHRLVDLVGDPEQGELTERGQVADPEVVPEGGIDLLGCVHVPVRHPPSQSLGRHVDQLDLVGRPYHRVRHPFPLRHPGDLLDDVVERLEVLDVDGRDDVDAGREQLLDVLPALLVARPGDIGVRELVDQCDLRVAGKHRVDVHLGERRAAMLELATRHDLEPADEVCGVPPSMRLDEAHDRVECPARRGDDLLHVAKVSPTPGAAPR